MAGEVEKWRGGALGIGRERKTECEKRAHRHVGTQHTHMNTQRRRKQSLRVITR